jgi:hypothetical protein
MRNDRIGMILSSYVRGLCWSVQLRGLRGDGDEDVPHDYDGTVRFRHDQRFVLMKFAHDSLAVQDVIKPGTC